MSELVAEMVIGFGQVLSSFMISCRLNIFFFSDLSDAKTRSKNDEVDAMVEVDVYSFS
jgi:hypothetical protein